MGFISFDTETTFIDFNDKSAVPELIVGQAYDGLNKVYLLDSSTIKRFFAVHSRSIFIMHNAAFDMGVIRSHIGDGAFFELYDENRIHDTSILFRLLKLAIEGEIPFKYNLALLSKIFLGVELDKNEDIRLTFGDYAGKPVSEIPIDHLNYAAIDSIATYMVYYKMLPHIKNHDKFNTMLSQDIQVKGEIALRSIERNGIGFDLASRDVWLAKQDVELSNLAEKISCWGYVRGMKGNTKAFENILKFLNIYDHLPLTETGQVSMASGDLEPFSEHEFIKDYLRFMEIEKATSFVRDVDSDRVHSRYTSILNTGRTSCIAKGELVDVLGGRKPIEDIRIGDLVYSYSKNNKLELKKVLNVFKQGIKPTIKINWKSIGNGKKGSLICTGDHKIKVRDLSNPYVKQSSKKEGWYRADELCKGDRLFHVTRGFTNQGRPRLYSADPSVIGLQEQMLIKEQIFKCFNHVKYHIHHKNGDRSCNSLNNLEIVDNVSHARHHFTGNVPWNKNKRLKEHLTYDELYNLYKKWYLYKEGNYDYIKKQCLRSDIKLVNISRHFKYDKEITLDMLISSASMTSREAHKFTGLDFHTWKKCMAFNNISINHCVESVEKWLDLETYDIEVEDNHNFIASEICVHNCSKPNIQQLPRVGGIRELFLAGEGKVFLDVDYSAIELSTLAQVCFTDYGFSNLGDLINEGQCPHYYTATKVYRKDRSLITKEERQFSKIPNFAFPTNMSPSTFIDYCKGYNVPMTLSQAVELKGAYAEAYPEISEHFWKVPRGEETSITLTGRVRAQSTYTAYLNTKFQGLASDGLKIALYELFKMGYKIVAEVHDQIMIEIDENISKEHLSIVEKVMIDSMKKVVPDIAVRTEGKISKVWEK